MNQVLLPFVAGLVLAHSAFAELNTRFHAEGIAQLRQLNQSGYSNDRAYSEGFLLTDLSVQWLSQHFMLEAKPQLRGVQSPGSGEVPPLRTSAKTSPRLLNSVRLLERSPDRELYFDLDRFNLRYQLGDFELSAGRRPLSFGVLRFFPVWNKLTLPLAFNPGPEWIENPDWAGMSTQLGTYAFRVVGVRGVRAGLDDIALGEAKYFGEGVEVQALAGLWWNHFAGGVAFSRDWGDRTVRLESLFISKSPDQPSLLQLGTGLETALNSKWTANVEAFFQSYQQSGVISNRFVLLSSRVYVFPFISYQTDGAQRWGLGGLVNLRDPSGMAVATFNTDVTDDLTLEVKAKIPVGRRASEFGVSRFEDPFGRTVGVPTTVYVTLSYTH